MKLLVLGDKTIRVTFTTWHVICLIKQATYMLALPVVEDMATPLRCGDNAASLTTKPSLDQKGHYFHNIYDLHCEKLADVIVAS